MNTTGPHVYQAINRVQAIMAKEGISKTRRNTQGSGYNFRGVDDVMNALAGHLADAGLMILPRAIERVCVERESKSGGALFYTTVKYEFDFVSSVDGSKHTVCMFGEAMDSGDKSTNKSASAAFKYACFQTFCIPTEGDNDADATTHEVARACTRHSAAPSAEKPRDKQPICEASKKRLASFRASEAGEAACVRLLSHWKLVDFDQITEAEANEAIRWIEAEVKRTTTPATTTKAAQPA